MDRPISNHRPPSVTGTTLDRLDDAAVPLPRVQVSAKEMSQMLQRMSEALASIGAHSSGEPSSEPAGETDPPSDSPPKP